MKRIWRGTLMLAAVCLLALQPSSSEAQKKKKKPEASAEKATEPSAPDGAVDDAKSQYLTDLMTAQRMIELARGKTNAAPELLIGAAGILRGLAKVSLDTVEEAPMVQEEGGKPEPAKEGALKAPDLETEAKDLLEEARAQAASLKINVEPLIKTMLERTGTRTVVGGPKQVARMIGGRQTHTLQLNVRPHQPVQFAFRSSIPLRVSIVRSDNDNAWGVGVGTNGMATYHPAGAPPGMKNVPITVRVHNPTKQGAQYQMFIN